MGLGWLWGGLGGFVWVGSGWLGVALRWLGGFWVGWVSDYFRSWT